MTIILLIAAAAAQPPAMLGRLAGQCWRGTLPGGGEDTHCFRRIGPGETRDRHVVRRDGAEVYWGETLYRAADGGLSYEYRNAGGLVMQGQVEAVPAGMRFTTGGGGTLWRWVQRGKSYAAIAGPADSPTVFRRVRP